MKFAAYLLAGIGLGVAVAYWQFGGEPGGFDSAMALENGSPVERRLSELETALALERYEREALARELAALEASLDLDPASENDNGAGDTADGRERVAVLTDTGDGELAQRFEERIRERFDGTTREERQIDRFVEAGFSPDRARWILEREAELQMEVLQARYDATQSGASAEEVANLSPSQFMREELGDADYERYLEGLGRPTTINIREVLTNSPAETAGIEPGDQILSYGGKRVFDMNELTSLTYEGRPGETVPVDVLRDGQQIQLYVERGPIGVSGGGRSTRRRR